MVEASTAVQSEVAMRPRWFGLIACLLLAADTLPAQDIVGTWQGTLGTSALSLRLILRIPKAGDGHWTASALSIDQGGFDDPITADSVSLTGRALRIVFGNVHSVYEGVVSRNDASITGTWTQRASEPLNFTRPTAATAWRDTSPHRSRFIAVEKDVRLEVLDWGGTGRPVVLLAGAGNSAHVFVHTKKGSGPPLWELGNRPVHKRAGLKFTASTNAPKPYEIVWQVSNTGAEARKHNSLRGGFEQGQGPYGEVRWEETSYRGTHFVEAFVIKNGVMVARSGRVPVRIAR